MRVIALYYKGNRVGSFVESIFGEFVTSYKLKGEEGRVEVALIGGIYYISNEDNYIELNKEQVMRLVELEYKYRNKIATYFSEVSTYKRTRFVYDDLFREVLNEEGKNIIELFGTRRTGKTILMLQLLNDLLRKGKKAFYFSLLKNNELDKSDIYDILYILHVLKYDYVLIDEITYVDDSLDFLNVFTDTWLRFKKYILAGTNSAVFLTANDVELYDRFVKVKTTYIPFIEYKFLYNDVSLEDYILNGALLKKSLAYVKEKELDLKRDINLGVDYIDT